MAVPKRRQSSARRDMRRSQWMKMMAPASSACPSCSAPRMPHRACDACGWYGPAKGGRVVIQQKEKTEASEQNS